MTARRTVDKLNRHTIGAVYIGAVKTVAPATVQLKGLGKKAMAQVEHKAKRLGMSTERYLRELVVEDLELDRKARSMTFAEIMGPGREVDESTLDELVEAAKAKHHRRAGKKDD